MKKSTCLFFFTLVSSGLVMAQADNLSVSAEASERARLAQERGKIESQYTAQETDCYKKFAVSSCIKQSKSERNAALADIKRQELALNDLERQKKKAEIDLKMSKPAASNQSAAGVDDRYRLVKKPSFDEKRRAEEAKKRAQEANEKMRASQAEAIQRAQKAKLANEQATKYQKKLSETAEHKAAAEQKRINSTQPKAAPLPVPKSFEN